MAPARSTDTHTGLVPVPDNVARTGLAKQSPRSLARRGFSIYLILAVVVICLICLAIIARNWSCRQPREPRWKRQEVRRNTGTFSVVSVPSGASIEVAYGRRDRKTAVIALEGIQVPAELAGVSRTNLAKLAGGTIRLTATLADANVGNAVEQADQRRLDETEDPGTTAETIGNGTELEAKAPTGGIVFGESGACLQLEQIKAGAARCLPEAPEDWKAAEQAREGGGGVAVAEGHSWAWWICYAIVSLASAIAVNWLTDRLFPKHPSLAYWLMVVPVLAIEFQAFLYFW